MVKAKKNFFLS